MLLTWLHSQAVDSGFFCCTRGREHSAPGCLQISAISKTSSCVWVLGVVFSPIHIFLHVEDMACNMEFKSLSFSHLGHRLESHPDLKVCFFVFFGFFAVVVFVLFCFCNLAAPFP